MSDKKKPLRLVSVLTSDKPNPTRSHEDVIATLEWALDKARKDEITTVAITMVNSDTSAYISFGNARGDIFRLIGAVELTKRHLQDKCVELDEDE